MKYSEAVLVMLRQPCRPSLDLTMDLGQADRGLMIVRNVVLVDLGLVVVMEAADQLKV